MQSSDEIAKKIKELHSDVTFELQKRERPDRHPYQVGCLFGLMVVSFSQIFIGFAPGSILYDRLAILTAMALNSVFVIGCILCLWGAALNRDSHFEMSLRLGMFGHVAIFAGCVAFCLIIIGLTEEFYWTTVTSVGFAGGIVYASVARFRQMYRLLKEYHNRRG